MSEISSRSNVHSISCATIVASAGVALLGTLLAAALDALSETSREKSPRPSRRQPASSHQSPVPIEALPALEARRVHLEEKALQVFQRRNLDPIEALKASTLKSFEGSRYVVNQDQVESVVKDFITATDLATAEKTRAVLIDATRQQHRKILEQSLTVACQNAALQVGFNRVQVAEGLLGCVRVIALNPEGKALVTELDAGDPASSPRIETEVVGVCDDSCTSILNAFDNALERQGVRSGPPARKHTGGVAELAAAREFLRTKPRPAAKSPKASPGIDKDSEEAARRAQRLNRSPGVELVRRQRT